MSSEIIRDDWEISCLSASSSLKFKRNVCLNLDSWLLVPVKISPCPLGSFRLRSMTSARGDGSKWHLNSRLRTSKIYTPKKSVRSNGASVRSKRASVNSPWIILPICANFSRITEQKEWFGMQEFQHIIITRFNLRNHQWSNRTKNNTPVLTESWLEDRFDLFENFCLPTAANL